MSDILNQPINRREFMKMVGLAGAALTSTAILSGCDFKEGNLILEPQTSTVASFQEAAGGAEAFSQIPGVQQLKEAFGEEEFNNSSVVLIPQPPTGQQLEIALKHNKAPMFGDHTMTIRHSQDVNLSPNSNITTKFVIDDGHSSVQALEPGTAQYSIGEAKRNRKQDILKREALPIVGVLAVNNKGIFLVLPPNISLRQKPLELKPVTTKSQPKEEVDI